MGDYLGKFFSGDSSAAGSPSSTDGKLPATNWNYFADYATPASAGTASPSISPLTFASGNNPTGSPWYAIWERHSIMEFKFEGYVLCLIAVVMLMHVWGSRRNRAIAKSFITTIAPVLSKEFALVGFGTSKPNTLNSDADVPFSIDAAIKEKSNEEFVTYASGRQNIAFLHATIKLKRRNNLVGLVFEQALSFFFDTFPMPKDKVTITIAPADGTAMGKSDPSSKYENFIWALVNKSGMKRWRTERYDLSLTRTSDWEGLPNWLAVMGESKEIGDLCLYTELKAIVKDCQEILQFLIVTDMPKDKPSKLEELVPKKRITLELNLPTGNEELTRKLLSAFIRLVDVLAAKAHFRPEVMRKVKAVREQEAKKLKRVMDEETKEERELKKAEAKKVERDAKLRGMTDKEQKKFLEKEREKERKNLAKKGAQKA